MILYHITNVAHLVNIENDRYLEVTESNVGQPEFLGNEALPPMVPILLEFDQDGLSSDPTSDEYVPTVMPREIFLKMWDEGVAPKRIPVDEFEALVAPMTTEHDGGTSFPCRIIVSWDSDTGTLTDSDEHVSGPEDIHVTEKFGEHQGPDVVWLTDDPTPTQDWQAVNNAPNMPYMFRKNVVLFTVEIPDEDVLRWTEWSREQGISERWFDALDGGTGDSEHWFVIPRRINKDEWLTIHNAETGSLYWSRDLGYVEGDDRFSIPLPTVWHNSELPQVI